ncbi:MAG: ISAs1 family transposase, partial [Nitrosomonadaceae bacterium]|nr:ISAs1 family transposase [Nitrosomonadaceae bacterium]
EVFAKSHQDWFVEHLLLTSGIPSSDTMRRVISMLEPKQFADSFLLWVRRVKELLQEQIVAIDGKTLRGSKIQNKGKKAIHLVNAYSCANGLTLKQIKVDDKSNEIKAIPEIINSLSLKGTIVTIDAMGCQKSITEHIIKVEADYILAVKGNHKSLQEPIQDIFTLARNPSFNKNLHPNCYIHEIDCEHGKIESRTVRSFSIDKISDHTKLDGWHGIRSIIEIEHSNHTKNSTDYRYYISTIPAQEIELIAKSIRQHWHIENNLHWTLDVVFKEDDSTIKHEVLAQNMSWIRKMATFLLKKQSHTKKISIKNKMVANCCKPSNLLYYLEC